MPGKKHIMGYKEGGVVKPAPKITDYDTLQAYVDATLAMDGPPKNKMQTPQKPGKMQTPQKPGKMGPSPKPGKKPQKKNPQRGQNNG